MRDKLKAAYKKSFDPDLEKEYKNLRNIVTYEKRKAKLIHFQKTINSKSKHSKKKSMLH